MALLDLDCPNGCDDGRFEALNAPLLVDAAGRYLEHDASAATYVCLSCRAVAIDVAAAAAAMRAADPVEPLLLRCPGCGVEMLPPEDDPQATALECPLCETRFAFEEGLRQLHGGGAGSDDDGAHASPS
jgi:DNA-directed RNA polymerase subunit RPC12/RpoP